jgi:hypothetical protein
MEPVCRPVSCGHVRDLGEAGFMYSDLRLRSQWFASVSGHFAGLMCPRLCCR